MLSGRQSLLNQLIMRRRRRQNHHHVDSFIRQKFVNCAAFDTVLPGLFLRAFKMPRGAGYHLQIVKFVYHILQINVADSAAPDNACAQLFFVHK